MSNLNVVLYLCFYIYQLINGYSLLFVYLQKEQILFYPRQNEFSICYQQTSHRGFQSLHSVRFSISMMFLCWCWMHEPSPYKSIVDVSACDISLTYIRNNTGPKMDPCGTLQEIFPTSECLFSIFTRNILSENYDFNHFLVI